MTNDLPSVGTALPAPFGFLCEWATSGGFPATQTVYYGGPGNGIDDDWNCFPEVYENMPIYTAEQMQAYARAAVQAAQPEVVRAAIPLTPFEMQSNSSRVNWAEDLIRQLPEDHDGRNSWLLNYGNAPRPKDYAFTPTATEPSDAERLDAARYRWLREHSDSMSLKPPLTVAKVTGWGLEGWSGDDLNNAIDAALNSSKEQP